MQVTPFHVTPFHDQGHYTAQHNALYDMVMPAISGNAWKLLCLIIRQTDGRNRDEIALSYRDLGEAIGCKAASEVLAAIDELRSLDLITVRATEGMEAFAYRLNREMEVANGC